LGGGAFSRVSKVVEESNNRAYALKRMRKATVLQCPEHVFCEQVITRNTAHPFCIRQVRVASCCLSVVHKPVAWRCHSVRAVALGQLFSAGVAA
jgi:hypothetical protein